jgi:hypothetical protein
VPRCSPNDRIGHHVAPRAQPHIGGQTRSSYP